MFTKYRKGGNETAVAPPPSATGASGSEAAALVGSLSREASGLGREAAEVRGVLEDTRALSQRQQQALASLAQQLDGIHRSQQQIDQLSHASLGSMTRARQAVEGVGSEVGGIVQTLRVVAEAAAEITQIALQTRLVAFNASVEAKRAGEAGRGFGVVADAVKDLAARVEQSSKQIMSTMGELDTRVGSLAREIQTDAQGGGQGAFHQALAEVERSVHGIGSAAQQSQVTSAGMNEQMTLIDREMRETSQALDVAMTRSESFLKVSEHLMELMAECGIETEDSPYIRAAQQGAGEIAALFEAALQEGRIGIAELFDEGYRPVPGTQPAQHLTRFVELTDRLLPPVQERLLALSPKVVFGIAADRNGYIATHNRKYNQAQRTNPLDAVWNAANCRNRRIFNDRTGLASARNRRPFLLQTYRRDMGGGRFVLLKEVSAPITVQGRHWGGLRLAYEF
ncbi:methyl-accepting chemotaxis protein [Caldimonas tepidiphila]|uniref:methyl-accepting chemotaxis protein n=1 Tax=Caldimonas tepidiphila TaxID=2315841 RepID=UPI000E5AD803|nr:methyl-accepting chemotaxis protein [Caldimonas tepidiphila]